MVLAVLATPHFAHCLRSLDPSNSAMQV